MPVAASGSKQQHVSKRDGERVDCAIQSLSFLELSNNSRRYLDSSDLMYDGIVAL